MKILILLLTITLLVSCTNQKKEVSNNEIENTLAVKQNNIILVEDSLNETLIVEETIKEVKKSMESLENLEKDDSKIQKFSYQYSNPAQEVDVDVSYSLDTKGKIATIYISSDNWDGLGWFNTGAQALIGKTLKEASEVGLIAWSSLTTAAFKEAIKSQL